MYRDHTKVVQIGNKKIGGGNPILIQSMTNTKTEDVEATKAAVAAGADGLMIEVHNDPAKAKCDGAQSLTPDQFDELMGFIRKEVEFFGKKMN